MKRQDIRKITVSAVLIALSTVLSMIKVVQMPLGGSVTLLSMVPICMVSVLYGVKFAIMPCILYGTVQMFIGGVFGWGLTPITLIGAVLFDFLIAFGSLCFAGLFRKKGSKGIVAGVTLACFLRFCSHFISGSIFFKSFDKFNNPYIFSLVYNGAYMLPELVITVVAVLLLTKFTVIDKTKDILGLSVRK